MIKRRWSMMVILLMIPALMLTVSCAKKAVRTEPAVGQQETEDERARAERARQEELARKKELERNKAIEEERLREARLREEAAGKDGLAGARNVLENEDIYFDFDSAVLSAEARDILKGKAGFLKNNPGITVIIEGHCDERGTTEYNLALGDRRATAAKAFLVDLGIEPPRLITVSYGEERPLDPEHGEESWAKNRRAHFVIRD